MSNGCLTCDATSLETVFSFRPTPPANALTGSAQGARELQRYPLDLARCAGCGHVQLADEVPRAELFSAYRYATGSVPALLGHCAALTADVVRRCRLAPGARVIEIGSNDGTLLRCFQEAGMRVLGIDPAADLTEEACHRGLPSLTAFFDASVAEKVRQEHGSADVVVANNVLAHVDDVRGMLDGIRILLEPGGHAVVEVAHVLPMAAQGAFEFVYHEHLSYFSLHALSRVAENHGLTVVDVQQIPTQGGSLRCWLRRADGQPRPARTAAVTRLLAEEASAGVPDGSFLAGFPAKAEQVASRLNDVVGGLARLGRRVCGYGASARAVTLLAQSGAGEHIPWIVDDNARKVGLYTPGDGIEVRDTARLREEDIDYCVLFAWNYASDIRRRHARFGGAFIAPLPELTIT
jgi:SAM-dependent methyltransferase